MKTVELAFWTFVAGALGAVAAVPLDVDVWKAAAIAGAGDLISFGIRFAAKRKAELEDEVEV